MTSSSWTVLHRYRAPLDPDYAGPPAVLTVWKDNLGGIVVGINQGDGATVALMPIPAKERAALAVAILAGGPIKEATTP